MAPDVEDVITGPTPGRRRRIQERAAKPIAGEVTPCE